MANMCSVNVVFEGAPAPLWKLYNFIELAMNQHKNGFGSMHEMLKLPNDCIGYYGEVDYLDRCIDWDIVDELGHFEVSMQASWSEHMEFWDEILKKLGVFDELKVHFVATELGSEYYVRSEEADRFFECDYHVDCFIESSDFSEYEMDNEDFRAADLLHVLREVFNSDEDLPALLRRVQAIDDKLPRGEFFRIYPYETAAA